MRRGVAFATLLMIAAPGFAGSPTGKVVLETWDAAYLGEGKAGYVRTVTREMVLDGKQVSHTTIETRLTVKRFNDTLQLAMDTGSIEDADGNVVRVFMKQFHGKQQVHIEGTVAGSQIHLMLNGNTRLKPAPWTGSIVGLYRQQNLFKDRDLQPGDTFSYRSFEPTVNLVVKTDVHVKGHREVALRGAREKQKLLLVEAVPEKLDFRNGDTVQKLQLPASLIWLDAKGEPAKTEFEVPGLGPVTLYRTTKANALAAGPAAQLSDIGVSQLVRVRSRIARPYETTAAVYRITIRDDDNAATAFSRDGRQEVKVIGKNTIELGVRAKESADGMNLKGPPAAEFAQSSYFITSDDPKVRQHARAAVGEETDAWRQAVRIEKWVHANIRATNHEALAPADQVARTLQGDCTEYAMLTAAMCRSVGIPSRTALGLIYADVKGTPCFAFHMWTEVWIKDRWIPIDATLGKGGVGATHLKITDHGWHDERTMAPLFPVIRVVGRLSIEVVGVENR